MATRTIANGGGNWTTQGTWVENAVPTANDDVVATATSGNLTVSGGVVYCKSLDFTGYVGTFTHSSEIDIGNATGGNLKLVAGMTYSGTTKNFAFVSTHIGNTITLGGKVPNDCYINGVGGTWTLQDAFTITGNIEMWDGTLSTNGQAVGAAGIVMGSGTSAILNLGSSTVTLTAENSHKDFWYVDGSTILTLNSATSTIILDPQSSSTFKAVLPSDETVFSNITILSGGTGGIGLYGNNYFNVLTIQTPQSLTIEEGKIQYIQKLVAIGTSSNKITLRSRVASSTTTVSSSSQQSVTYLLITDITATGSGVWYAGGTSTLTRTSGWINSSPTTSGSGFGVLQFGYSPFVGSEFGTGGAF